MARTPAARHRRGRRLTPWRWLPFVALTAVVVGAAVIEPKAPTLAPAQVDATLDPTRVPWVRVAPMPSPPCGTAPAVPPWAPTAWPSSPSCWPTTPPRARRQTSPCSAGPASGLPSHRGAGERAGPGGIRARGRPMGGACLRPQAPGGRVAVDREAPDRWASMRGPAPPRPARSGSSHREPPCAGHSSTCRCSTPSPTPPALTSPSPPTRASARRGPTAACPSPGAPCSSSRWGRPSPTGRPSPPLSRRAPDGSWSTGIQTYDGSGDRLEGTAKDAESTARRPRGWSPPWPPPCRPRGGCSPARVSPGIRTQIAGFDPYGQGGGGRREPGLPGRPGQRHARAGAAHAAPARTDGR